MEGAALATAVLEWFAGSIPKEEGQGEGGALLTLATTHHGELKMLKYRYLLVQGKRTGIVWGNKPRAIFWFPALPCTTLTSYPCRVWSGHQT